jgi:hypothetical protein
MSDQSGNVFWSNRQDVINLFAPKMAIYIGPWLSTRMANLVSGSSTLVEYTPHHPEVEGSIPTCCHREIETGKKAREGIRKNVFRLKALAPPQNLI